MINHFREQMPRPIIGIGHSIGPAQLCAFLPTYRLLKASVELTMNLESTCPQCIPVSSQPSSSSSPSSVSIILLAQASRAHQLSDAIFGLQGRLPKRTFAEMDSSRTGIRRSWNSTSSTACALCLQRSTQMLPKPAEVRMTHWRHTSMPPDPSGPQTAKTTQISLIRPLQPQLPLPDPPSPVNPQQPP